MIALLPCRVLSNEGWTGAVGLPKTIQVAPVVWFWFLVFLSWQLLVDVNTLFSTTHYSKLKKNNPSDQSESMCGFFLKKKYIFMQTLDHHEGKMRNQKRNGEALSKQLLTKPLNCFYCPGGGHTFSVQLSRYTGAFHSFCSDSPRQPGK